MTEVLVRLPLAHAGEGATWQALLTLLALGLVAVVLLVAAGVVRVEEPGDLILPLAGTAVLASLSGATSEVLSDWVGWAFPLGVVALLALLLVALTPLRLSPTSPVLLGAVAIGAVASLSLHGPITRAWHPATSLDAVALDDLAITIVEPADGATVDVGTVEVVVRAEGGTLGSGPSEAADAVADPEEQVTILLTAQPDTDGGLPRTMLTTPVEDCSQGCETATYTVELDAPGEWTLYVEALTAASQRFDTTPLDSVTVTATD